MWAWRPTPPPVQEADDYFRAWRKELEEALQEGAILIERQVVTLV